MHDTLRSVLLSSIMPLLLLACDPGTAATRGTEEGGDPIVNIEADDTEMNAAKAEAQRTLPEFLAVLANPPAGVGNFGFKYPLGGWEHIWVDDVRREGNFLTGTLGNDPVQKGYSLGEKVRVPLNKVSDWGYSTPDGVVQGHRTTKVLLGRMPKEQAEQIKAQMGWN